MIKTTRAVLAVVAGILVGSSVFAADWNGLTVDGRYDLRISESGVGSGHIQQWTGLSPNTNVAVTAGVGYSLPQISVTEAASNPFWGVCIDTHEWMVNPEPAILKKGWDAGLSAPGEAGRLNGTVLNELAWQHTTYLFSQYGGTISAMSNAQKAAFQLATWEVMSGDGSTGATWSAGNFRATNVSGNTATWANTYVNAAYTTGFTAWSDSGKAEQSFYFSGVKVANYYQDYLVYAPSPVIVEDNPVPEPMSLMLGIMGLGSVAGLKRLRRK